MDIAQTVTSYIRAHPGVCYCDDCLAEVLNLSRRQQAFRVTSALGKTAEFDRATGTCDACGDEKLVIGLAQFMLPDLAGYDVAQLLNLHSQIEADLRRREVVRSANNPVGDYAETLFCKAFGWDMAAASEKGFDATDADGQRYQIKARRMTAHNTSRQLSALRNLDAKPFDYLAGMLFDSTYGVLRAALIPHQRVLANTRVSSHTNSHLFFLRDSVWDWPDVQDVTRKLRQIRL